jgi:hypothetical protein
VTGDQYGRPVGPAGTAGDVVGGVVATADVIATAPFRAFDSSYNIITISTATVMVAETGRPMRLTIALPVRPGTMFKGADGRQPSLPVISLTLSRKKRRLRKAEPPFP